MLLLFHVLPEPVGAAVHLHLTLPLSVAEEAQLQRLLLVWVRVWVRLPLLLLRVARRRRQRDTALRRRRPREGARRPGRQGGLRARVKHTGVGKIEGQGQCEPPYRYSTTKADRGTKRVGRTG